MIEAALRRLALLASRRYKLVFLVVLVMGLLALVPARKLRFDTRIESLLPPNDPAVRVFTDTVEIFGSLEQLLVVVRIPDGEPVAPYLEFVDALGTRLSGLEEIDTVEYSIGKIEEMAESFLQQAFLSLGEAQRAEILDRLSEEGIGRRVQELRRQIGTPQALFTRSLLQLDPLGLSGILAADLGNGYGALKLDWSSGYMLSADKSMVLIVARPILPPMEPDFAKRMIAVVNEVTNEELGRWEDLAGPEPLPRPLVELGGAYATVVEDTDKLTGELILNLGTAMLGVLILFALAFRRISLVGYAFLPLGFGLVLAFGFAAIAFGALGALSSGFAALLVGLALDFVIVSYGRYVEERRAGADLFAALSEMAATSGRAVVIGAVTTAATFYAFAVTEFKGLREMGLLTGTGILLCMAAVLVLLPALMSWSEHRHHRRTAQVRHLRLHAFSLGHLVSFSFHRPRLVLVGAAAITLAAGLVVPRLQFEDDFRKMRPAGVRGVEIQKEVASAFGSDFESMMLVIRAKSEEDLLARIHRAEAAAQELVEKHILHGIDSISALIPSAGKQEEAIQWLRRNEEILDGEHIRAVFSTAALREGLRAEAFEKGLLLLERATAIREPIGLQEVEGRPHADKLLRRYTRRTEDDLVAVVYLQIPSQGGKLTVPTETLELVEELGEGFALTGANVLGAQLRGQIRSDALTAGLVGFFVVGFLLHLEYRRLTDALLCLLPLSIGMAWMLGGMVLSGQDMNFFNIFVTTMIIGIGVDYGIHMVNRFREHEAEGPEVLARSLHETGRAVVLAALSTTVGFGSLSLSHYPGVRSMGLVSILGALATAFVATTVLPALFSLMQGARRP